MIWLPIPTVKIKNMFDKNKIEIDHYQWLTLKGICEDLYPEECKSPKKLKKIMSAVSYQVIEMGVAAMLSSKKLTVSGDDALTELVKTLRDAINKDTATRMMVDSLEKLWEAGKHAKG